MNLFSSLMQFFCNALQWLIYSDEFPNTFYIYYICRWSLWSPKNTSFSLVSFSRQVTRNFKSNLYWSQPIWVPIIWIQWYIQISVNQIYKRYLYICKSFSANTIVSTTKRILHKILISAKCLISVSNKQLNERLQYFKTKNKRLQNLLSKNLVN